MRRLQMAFGDRQDGQGLAEYAIILTMIAVVVIGAVIFLGGQLNTMISNVGKSI